MGKCYELEMENLKYKALFQVINQGGDVSSGQFDVQLG